MFEGIEAAANDEGAGTGRFAASTGISVGICVILGVVLAAVGTGVARSSEPEQQDVQVSFQEPAAEEPRVDEPPPPPPAPRPDPKKRTSTKPPAAPTILPGDELAEGDENDFRGSGSDAIDDLTAPVLPDAMVKSGAPPAAPTAITVVERVERGDPAPIDMVDHEWVEPQPITGNASPTYPEDARKRGLEGIVIVRFLITRDGRVTHIQAESGAEPFVTAAIAAVKTWRYQPGRLAGHARDAWHRVRLPFQLSAR